MNTRGRLPFIDSLLARVPPVHLFHYTSPDGLIGILKSMTLWATHPSFMNDRKEQLHAVEIAQNALYNYSKNQYASMYSDEEHALFESLSANIHATNRQIYTVSLTAQGDLLQQWLAYCPRSGGYALGLPSYHLRVVGEEQGFYLTPCIYENVDQYRPSMRLSSATSHHLKTPGPVV